MSKTDRLSLAVDAGELRLPDTGSTVFLRAEPAGFLTRDLPVLCEQSFRPNHDRLADEGLNVSPRVETEDAGLVIVNATRSRAENLGNVARGLAMLRPGGTLAVNGNKTDGIDSLVRQVGKALPAASTWVKAHGRVSFFERPDALPAEAADWTAGAAPSKNEEGFWTMAGVFSPDGSDPGSHRLVEAFDKRVRGRVADLGAGWGWLSALALHTCDKITGIDLYEAESRALDCAERNVADPRAGFHWADVPSLPRMTEPYDTVICNPPFHQGRAAEPDLGAAFIATAARIMKPAATLFMVANRQLPYEAALDANFGHWKQLSADRNFKVILAARPKRRTGR